LALIVGCDSGKPTPPAAVKPAANDPKTASKSDPSSPSAETAPMLKVESIKCGETPDGSAVTLYTLSNSKGMRVKLINFGGIITAVEVPDRNGRSANVTASFPGLNEDFENAPYFGGICGRFANRISNAKFTLDDKEYELFANVPPNHLHGGKVSFIKKLWDAETIT